jgi:ABC-type glycerol-3-phosphate transport system substrate-binding protein
MKMMKPSGNAAVRSSVGNLYEESPLLTWWQTTLKYVSPDQGSPFNKDLRAVTVPMFQQVMTGQQTPAQAVAEAAQKGNELLQSLLTQVKPE